MGPGHVLRGSSGLTPSTQGSILSPHVLTCYPLSASGLCAFKCSKKQSGKCSHQAKCLQLPVFKDSSQEQSAKQWDNHSWQPAEILRLISSTTTF